MSMRKKISICIAISLSDNILLHTYLYFKTIMYEVSQSRNLSGSVTIGGSKNAGLPLLAAALLIPGKVTLHNVPEIIDTYDFLHFYESLGARYEFQDGSLSLDTSDISLEHINTEKIARTRAGIYFMAGLLSRFGEAKLPYPSGDKIGKRPIDEHINGYV